MDMIDFLYQSRPNTPESLACQFRFKDAGDFTVDVCLFSFATRNIAINFVITSHLLALVGHVRAHSRECLCLHPVCEASRRSLAGPFQSIDYLGFLPVFGPLLHLAGLPMLVQHFDCTLITTK